MAATLILLAGLFVSAPAAMAKEPQKASPVVVKQPAAWPAAVMRGVAGIDRKFEGRIGVYIKDIEDDLMVSYEAGRPWYLASVVKIFVMIEIHKLLETGRLSLQDAVRVGSSSYRDGSTKVNYVERGERLTIGTLLDFMMVKSDNAATDMLMGLIGLDRLEAAMRAEGLFDLGRLTTMLGVRKRVYGDLHPLAGSLTAMDFIKIWRQKNFDQRVALFFKLIGKENAGASGKDLSRAFARFVAQGYNSSSLRTLGLLLERLAEGRVVTPGQSEAMLKRMRRCETGRGRIKAGMPRGWEFAHKTGTQHRHACDVGVLLPPVKQVGGGHRIVMAICAADFTQRSRAEKALADTARLFFRHYLTEK